MMNTKNMTAAEMKARAMIAAQSTERLIEQYELLDRVDRPQSLEACTVRGWYMDELEARDPEAFDAWIDVCEKIDSPRTFFLN